MSPLLLLSENSAWVLSLVSHPGTQNKSLSKNHPRCFPHNLSWILFEFKRQRASKSTRPSDFGGLDVNCRGAQSSMSSSEVKKSSLLRIPFSLKCFYLPGQNFLVLNFKYEFICACLQTDFLQMLSTLLSEAASVSWRGWQPTGL